MITRAARIAVRFPKVVIAVWAVSVLTLTGIGAPTIQKRLLPATLFLPGTESYRWFQEKQPNYGEAIAMALEGSPAQLDKIGPKLNTALNQRPLTRAQSPWTPSAGNAVKILRPQPDLAVFAMDVRFAKGQNESTVVPPLDDYIRSRIPAGSGVKYYLSGDAPLGRDINSSAFEALHQGEIIAAPLLVLVLLLVFRSPIAAAIPLMIAGGTVGSGMGVLWILTHFIGLDLLALSLLSMLGFALGVDYPLLLVSRFREGLAEGMPPRQAATLAANTAGRTALFAAFVLSALMITTMLVGTTLLKGAAIGAMCSTIIAAISGVMVCPAILTLLGHRVNGGIVRVVGRRPIVAALLVGGWLLLLASPVLALKTTPVDPHQLAKSDPARFAYDQIRRAGMGPNVDVVFRQPGGGAITSVADIKAIGGLEDDLAKIPYVKFIAGPGLLVPQVNQLATAPAQIRAAKRELANAETTLKQKIKQVNGAKNQLATDKVQLSQGLGSAQSLLNEGQAMLANVGGQFTSQFGTLISGLGAASSGAGQLASGALTLKAAAALLANVLAQVRDKIKQLTPQIQDADKQIRSAQASLSLLRLPAQITVREIQNAQAALNAATIGQSDPQVQIAKVHIEAALAAATGSTPIGGVPGYTGLDNSLAQAATMAAAAGDQVDGAVRQAGYAYDAFVQIADGAGRLVDPGLSTLIFGLKQLHSGLALAHDKVAAAAPQIQALQSNATALLSQGQSQLNQAGATAFPQLQAAQDQLNDAGSQLTRVQRQLISKTGPFKPLRTFDSVQQNSPFIFDSPYILVAALQGARQVQRKTAETIIDSSTGGNIARIVMLPGVPTNSPQQDLVVNDTRALTHAFAKKTGMDVNVGGSAAELLDFKNVMATRVPLLILSLCLVTYLMLVPILRSVLLPAIAVGLNLLTVGVAMSFVTLASVDGAFGIFKRAPIGGAGKPDIIAVAAVFCIIFALSIDYYVFLLLRMREEYVRTQDNATAVQFGIEKTGRIVTGAALIMVATFFAFALADFTIIRELGLGLTVAIATDATFVRLGLLPALMRGFGDWTWWMPKWLDEKLPTFDVEGAAFEHEAALMPHSEVPELA